MLSRVSASPPHSTVTALGNIADAIWEYLEAEVEQLEGAKIQEQAQTRYL